MRQNPDFCFMPFDENSELKNLLTHLFSLKRLSRENLNQRFADHIHDVEQKSLAALEISRQLRSLFYTHSLTDAGINSSLGFFPELRQRLRYRLLPPLNEDNFFSHFMTAAFSNKSDYLALEKLSDENWNRLFDLAASDVLLAPSLVAQLENAIVILTHRFVTIGIDPYVVRKVPRSDDTDSPFFELNVLVNEYVKERQERRGKQNEEQNESEALKVAAILENLERCVAVFTYLKDNRATLGISLHLTFTIRRAEQHVQRIRLLLQICTATGEQQRRLIRELILVLVRAELYSTGIRYFISENTSLLANRIASQTSSRGGDYIGFTKKENNRLLLSAMGGGLVVVFLVYIKHYIHLLHLPLLPEGILFGLNYGLGFVLMHFLHWTLATKQPAMTASYIAESIERKGLSKESRKGLAVILAQIVRSQFISLIGNLLVVLPLSFLSAWLFVQLFSFHTFNAADAMTYLKGNHPLLSASLIFAVFTGVFLTLAGLITGYYDNKVVFSAIPLRVTQHPVLRHVLPKTVLEKLAQGISRHFGAVLGNLCLGFFLGLAGTFGKFIGLPFDIRHITISAGNFGIAVAQGYGFTKLFVAVVFLGVITIGVVNIVSSFLFSFLIACRSRYLSSRQTWLVLGSMVSYIFRNPGILIFRKDDVVEKR